MTTTLSADLIAGRLAESLPDAVVESNERDVWVRAESVHDVCSFLKDDADLKFDYLVSISAVDYIEHFEVVYHLVSMAHNHGAVVKTRCWGREEPSVPSVTGLWQGADFQEREVYDLMGVTFTGHANLKRLLLWEGYPGHPQRKDYLEPPR